jgi:hypothetical protein
MVGKAFGVCTPSACVGDRIVLLTGCSFPVLLRERPDAPGTYIYVKEAYLPGFIGFNIRRALKRNYLRYTEVSDEKHK